jgi:hydrogenase maturation factor
VTEGGIATALAELSQAGGRGLCIRRDSLPVYPLTRRMGEILGIDPLGLIGSGSLLICCRPDHAPRLISELEKNDIAVADIGEVVRNPPGIDALECGSPVPWPRFDVDEITRLFG